MQVDFLHDDQKVTMLSIITHVLTVKIELKTSWGGCVGRGNRGGDVSRAKSKMKKICDRGPVYVCPM